MVRALVVDTGRRRAPAVEDAAVQARPMIKSARKSRYTRCQKCGKQLRKHTVRCKTCHLLLKK
jgi:lipopolysaccharide biosynthesis regulator YciM